MKIAAPRRTPPTTSATTSAISAKQNVAMLSVLLCNESLQYKEEASVSWVYDESAIVVNELETQENTDHEKGKEKAVSNQNNRYEALRTWLLVTWRIYAIPNTDKTHAANFSLVRAS